MGCVLRMIVVGTGQLPNSTGVVFGVGFPTHSRCSFENTPMHHRGVLFGREAFGRVGVDFAWNVHVVKIGTAGQELARVAILPRSIGRGTAGQYGSATWRHPAPACVAWATVWVRWSGVQRTMCRHPGVARPVPAMRLRCVAAGNQNDCHSSGLP